MCWESHQDAGNVDVNGVHSHAEWSICDTFHANQSSGSDVSSTMSCLNHFMQMFPTNAMHHIVTLTNAQLGKQEGQHNMGIGKLLQFFNLLLFMTCLLFSK